MPTIIDSFPSPSLDATKWNIALEGGASYAVGSPIDGVYPQGIDDQGDGLIVDSEGKIVVPSGSFDVSIFYADVFVDPEEDIFSFLGWRSNQLDLEGNPAFAVDVLLSARSGPVFEFQKATVNLGSYNRTTIISDPTNGADGGFRIVRNWMNYSLFYFDGVSFQPLAVENIPHNGAGYIVFGQVAESFMLEAFPWVSQT